MEHVLLMALNESDREDLMAEATALRRRIALQVPGFDDEVIAGFRDAGQLSIFFGSDPVYQFDENGLLRRAFVEGSLYRSQGTTLARLTRERTETTSSLIRHDLNGAEIVAFLATMFETLRTLQHAIEHKEVTVIQQIPEDNHMRPDVLDSLSHILNAETPFAPPINANR